MDFFKKRQFDSYRNFAPSSAHQNDTLETLSSLRRYEKQHKFNLAKEREADVKYLENQLFRIKKTAPEVTVASRPLMGLCCQNCTFTSRQSFVKDTTKNLALVNILRHPKSRDSMFSHLYQVMELKRYNYPQVEHLVLRDEEVKKSIEEAAWQQFQNSDNNEEEFHQKLIRRNQSRAKSLVLKMSSIMSDYLLRFSSWVLYKILPCFINSLVVHPGQLDMLKEASKTNHPLIFLPLHKSDLDNILISFILFNNNIRLPLVASKRPLLRRLGAFFVIPSKDLVYKALLHTYVTLCLRAGHSIEFFLEEKRTRTGKASMPKNDMLSIVVDAVTDGTLEDALLVPVSVNYEKLIDGNFISEQLGQIKKPENIFKRIWRILHGNYGIIRVDFNQPFSLSELIKARLSIPLVESISKHVMYDCAQSSAVMSTNALAFLLLTKYRNGATLEQLMMALEDLKNDLNYFGRDIGFTGDSVDVINYSVQLFGPGLIKKNKDVIQPVIALPNVLELAYYSNILVSQYALESVVALALSVSKITLDKVLHDDLIKNALELCSLFQYEFLFCKPCQNLEQAIASCIDDLIVRREIFLPDEADNNLVKRSKIIAAQFDDEDQEELFQKYYRINSSEEAKSCARYLANILMPLLVTYAITGFTLDKLVERQLLENELLEEILDELKNQLDRGSVRYAESIAVEPIKNALKLYQKWGILECHQEDDLRLYYLKGSEDNSESVKMFYDRVNKYKEGNNGVF